MRSAEGDRICEIIRRHRGRAQAITATQLCFELGWPPTLESAIRDIISAESMLWPGLLVCHLPGAGFFCATSCEEAFACESWLRGLRDQAQADLDAFTAQCRRLGLPIVLNSFDQGIKEGIAEIMAAKQAGIRHF